MWSYGIMKMISKSSEKNLDIGRIASSADEWVNHPCVACMDMGHFWLVLAS